jgi:hypothetical protein
MPRALLILAALALATPATAQRAGWVDARFAQADVNRDGQLSRGEVTRAVNRSYPGGRMTTGRSRILTNFWFNRLDGDRNNAVTLREARAAEREYRARFDRNRNGRIDPAERRALDAFLRNPAR